MDIVIHGLKKVEYERIKSEDNQIITCFCGRDYYCLESYFRHIQDMSAKK